MVQGRHELRQDFGGTKGTMVFLKVAYDLSSKPKSRGDLSTVQVEGSLAQTASGRQVQGRFLLQLFHVNHDSSLSQLPLILWHIHTWGVLLCLRVKTFVMLIGLSGVRFGL